MKIAILGAGLVGRLLAFQLRNHAWIDLFDQDSGDATDSAAYLAAAMLAPLAESAEAGRGIMQLGEVALEIWPKLLKKLPEEVFFQRTGSLLLAFEQDLGSLRTLEWNLKGDNYSKVNAAEISQLENEINPRFAQGLFLPDEGQLDNRQLLAVLGKALQSTNTINWQTHSSVEVCDDGFSVNDQSVQNDYDWIIDCRGLGAKQSQSDLRGVRGEVIRLYAPDVTLNRPVRLMHPRYPIYIAPKANHHFVVGATQLESEDHRNPTLRSAMELLSSCFSVHSGFAEAEILQIQSGLRPAYIDNEPKMRVKGRMISINGLFRHGYLLSPVMIDLCKNYLLGREIDARYLQALPNLIRITSRLNTVREHV